MSKEGNKPTKRKKRTKGRKMAKLTLSNGKNLEYRERAHLYWVTVSSARGRLGFDANVEGIIHNLNAVRFNNNPQNVLAARASDALLDVIENGVKKRRSKAKSPNNVVTFAKRAVTV